MHMPYAYKMKNFWNSVWHIQGNERRPVAIESLLSGTELQLEREV